MDSLRGSVIVLAIVCFSLIVVEMSWLTDGSDSSGFSYGYPFSGIISSDTTWTPIDSPYWIEGNVTIQEGNTLTIEAGVEVLVNGEYAFYVDGNLTVQGDLGNPIMFTSNNTFPQVGDWKGLIVNSTGHVLVEYASFSHHTYIWLYSSNNSIHNCDFYESHGGIYVVGSNDNSFENNTFAPLYLGIQLSQSSQNLVANNTFQGGLTGIGISGESSWNTMTGNSFRNQSQWGIVVGPFPSKEDFNQSIDSSNTVNGLEALYLLDSSNLTVRNATLGHLTIAGGENVILENVSLPRGDGISLAFSTNITLRNCSASGGFNSLRIHETSFVNVSNFMSTDSTRGVEIWYSNDVNLNEVTSTSNEDGVDINYSQNVTIFDSNVSNNLEDGIEIHDSSKSVLRNNSLWLNGQLNLHVIGQFEHEYNHEIDTSNQVNGNPVYYFFKSNGLTVENVVSGHIDIVLSSDVRVENVTVMNGDFLNLDGVSFCRVNNSTLTNNYWGVSSNSDNCTLENLTISGNARHGISVIGNHMIKNNTISNNGIGISALGSSVGMVFHNNFISNQDQTGLVYEYDRWDGGYPMGGNYWSDYQGADMCHGPSQDILGSDGIGDTPYLVGQNLFDNYPLMRPVGTVWDSISPGPINDLTVIETTSNDITLQWTSPGDDLYSGQATAYDLRFSLQPINDTNWDSATQPIVQPVPKPTGETETFTVSPLTTENTYFFAIITSDEVPNWSPISNVPNGTTFDDIPPTISEVLIDPFTQEVNGKVSVSAKIEDNHMVNSTWLESYHSGGLLKNLTMFSCGCGRFCANDSYSVVGLVMVTIWASDQRGNMQNLSVGFEMVDTTPPIADAGENVTVDVGDTVVFVSDSYDNHGIANYSWTFFENGAQVFLHGETAEYKFTKPGVYHVVLIVKDFGDNEEDDDVYVTVLGKEDLFAKYWWVIAVVVVVVVLVVIVLLWGRFRGVPTDVEGMDQEFEEKSETGKETR